MKLRMFSVRDAKAQAFITPFFLPNQAMAEREFTACCNDPNHQFCKYAEDFSLYHVGEFEIDNGTFQGLPEPKFLVSAIDCKGVLS